MKLAPIALFVYNRPRHTQITIETLKKNTLASQSELFVFSDAAKTKKDESAVEKVRALISGIQGFKKVTVIKKDSNWGLARSIMDGVDKLIDEYGKIVVLEDDLVTSPYFLKYMNDALAFYEDNKEVWHISGWNYPIKNDGEQDVFLWRAMNCWGWATWSDRWQHFEKDASALISSFNDKERERFNLDGAADFFGQIILNQRGEINTWAVFWYATIFKHNGLCLNPVNTYVENIGLDGSGENCVETNMFHSRVNETEGSYNFVTLIKEDISFLDKIKQYYNMNKKTKFAALFNWFKKKYIKEQFSPSLLGIFINPFYFSRKALKDSLAELLPELSGSILDIGCGSKPYKELLSYDKYIGLELESSKKRATEADYYYDGVKMPFETGSMDSVLTNQVFEHVFNPNSFLIEINRVLKNNGILLLTAPLIWAEHEQPHDYARYTSFGLKHILQKHGFEIIKFKKTANDFTALTQVLASLVQEKTFGDNQYLNIIITILLISPINILGLLASKILPKNDSFYLDNVVLAKKIKNAN